MEGKIIRRVGQRLAMSWAALVMCAAVSGGDGTSTTPDKQDQTPTGDVREQGRLRPLPPDQTKDLTALVIGVKGWAQWRPSDKAEWKNAKVKDVLYPGAQIRTAMRSSITLRVGENATIMVGSLSRVDLPVILQKGAVLRTRVAVRRGRADLKVELVELFGLTNDFIAFTPSARIPVLGTGFAVTWGALKGLEIDALATNVIHAIEVRYLLTNRSYYLSGPGATRENQPDPVEVAFDRTIVPTIAGELTKGESLAEPQDERRVDYSRIGLAETLAFVSSFEPPIEPCISLQECAERQREMQ